MFEEYVKDAISKFDSTSGFCYVEPEDVLDQIKDTNKYIYNELMYYYYSFDAKKKKKEVYKNIISFCERNLNYEDVINRFLGALYLADRDYDNARNYFLKSDDYEYALYASMQIYYGSKSEEDLKDSVALAQRYLNIVCKPKSKEEEEYEYIEYPIFSLLLDDCIKRDNFSSIVYLIDLMYSSFRKNEKYETFYNCIIKLADVKDIKLSFQQNKDFFSRENFQTVCYKVKEVISSNTLNHEEVVASFEENLNRANDLRNQKDLNGAENLYREAIKVASTLKQRNTAFKKIFEMYENIDNAKMLTILDEFEKQEVFESNYQKYYFKAKMIVKSKSNNYDTIEVLKMLATSIGEYDIEKKFPNKINDLVIKCLELIKLYVQNMLNADQFDDAHAGCKLAIALNKYNKKNHYKINEYISYFTTKQTLCGKIKKDLAKKGNAKINVPTTTTPIISKTPVIKETIKDPNDMPIFSFNSNISSSLHYYMNTFRSSTQSIEDTATLNFDDNNIMEQILNILEPIEISNSIKSIYIVENRFVGNYVQARSDIDFYINSKIRTNPAKKRDEYFSFIKILQDVINRFGEDANYNIDNRTMNEYVVKGLTYHSECLQDRESRQYFLFIAELLRKNIKNKKYLNLMQVG